METRIETAKQGKMPDTTNTMTKQVNGGSGTSPGSDGRVRCAIYARYLSDNQRKSSIEDQIRNCREAADRNGWVPLR